MDPAIKKVAIVLAAALVVVLGLIFMIQGADSKDAQVATQTDIPDVKQIAQIPQTKEADAQTLPAQEADASEVSETNEASEKMEETQTEVMYEGALAGLSEEEIAKMALAEEQGTERTETTGTETAID